MTLSSQLRDIHFYSFCPILCFAVGVEKQGPIQNSYRTLTQLNNKKTHYPVKKMGKTLEYMFFQRSSATGQPAHRKTLGLIGHFGNAIQNLNEIPLHTQ